MTAIRRGLVVAADMSAVLAAGAAIFVALCGDGLHVILVVLAIGGSATAFLELAAGCTNRHSHPRRWWLWRALNALAAPIVIALLFWR